MTRRLAQLGRLAALSSLLLAGCKGAPDHSSVQNDPMVTAKRGILVSPDAAKPGPILHEPTPPPMPRLEARSKEGNPSRITPVSAPAASVPDSSAGVKRLERPPAAPVTPAKTTEPSVAAPAARVGPVGAPGTYGHANDHSWLQGKVDRPYSGGVKLRYCDVCEDDAWGGSVFLVSSLPLEGLKNGAIILVEGRPAAASNRQGFFSNPTYEVQRLTVLRE
jgi:hypothetical protein